MNQNDIDKNLDDIIDKAEEDIEVVHAKRMKILLNRLEKMFREYTKDGVLTYAEMVKYNRIEKELEFMAKEFITMYSYLAKDILKLMQQQYSDNYFQSAYLYGFAAHQFLGYGALSKATIQAAISNPIPDLELPKLMEHNRNQIIRRIRTEITQGLQAGEDYSKMAKRIKYSVEFSSHKAKMVARTEAHRAQVQGRMDSAVQASKHASLKKMWDGTLDSHTRLSHRKLDGAVKELHGIFNGLTGSGPAPGLMSSAGENINCRCTLNYLVNGKKPQLRRVRLVGGQTKVIPYQSYEEWYTNEVESGNELSVRDVKRYSMSYRKKLQAQFDFFKSEGYLLTEHAVNRSLGQKKGKNKKQFTNEDILDTLRTGKQYLEERPEKPPARVFYKNNVAVLQAIDNNQIITIVDRPNPKSNWREIDE
ncbi:phage minor head protein [Ornithinibacillus xuwenensis]|uniref:Phage minor head protein n=1 Tax=Ornithinibacillus xuwenensis TaxID=3144668 RepID=A0ABU9XC34_9BACI